MSQMFMAAALLLVTQTPATPSAQPPSGGQPEVRTMEMMAVSSFASIRRSVTALAERMPEDGYAYQPTSQVRTFAAALTHLVASNVNVCGNLRQKKHALSGQDLGATLTSRAEILRALEDSYAFCGEYFTPREARALTRTYFETALVREGQKVPVKIEHGAVVSGLIAHNNEMYGYLSMYLRLKGLVPPTSDPRR